MIFGKIDEINLNNLPENNEGQIIESYKNKLYETLIRDFKIAFGEYKKNLVFLLPYLHSKKFIEKLKQAQADKNSILYNTNIEIAILDKENLKNTNYVKNFPENIEKLLKKIKKADKYIEIYDTGKELETFASNENDRQIIADTIKSYLKTIGDIIATKPKLKTYFPSQEQADLENLSLEEFYKLFLNACNLDWNYIYEANQELVKLFDEYDYIKIIGEKTNITYCIKGMKGRNSVIQANYPGAEVFSAPVKNQVNGYIFYPNKTFFKYSGDVVENLFFEFKKGKLVKLDILLDSPDKEKIIQNFLAKFNEHPENRFLGEIAFGTNPNIPVGTKHKLIGEKAFGMHMALGKAYKYPGVNNGNNNATIHRDAIRTLKNTKVFFGKENGEEILVINNEKYNSKYCPKLSKLKQC